MNELIMFGLSGAAWMTLVAVVTVFVLMIFTKLPADLVFIGSTVFLYVSGILDANQAMGGFSSTSVVTVGVLFVVVSGLVRTGVLEYITKYLMGTPRGLNQAVVRLMLPVAALSAFLTNTTIVAMFIQIVGQWAKKLNIAPSRLLIPLSYASGMGGVCTLIGTPPNLIVSGLYQKETGDAMNIFITLPIGCICLAVGIFSLLALQRLLPIRKSPLESLSKVHDFTVELLVPSDNPHIGESVSEAKLAEVPGGHLVEIVRFDKETISPVSPDEFIFGGDRLIYSGEVEKILELKKKCHLVNATTHVYSFDEQKGKRRLTTASIPFGSNFIGKTMASTDFEKKEEVVLVAISRQGERIHESPRQVALQAGDTLLLEGVKTLDADSWNFSDQLLLQTENQITVKDTRKTLLSSLIMLLMVALSALKVLPLLQACFLAAFAMIICRCCSIAQARKSIDWSLLMVFAGSVSLGVAIQDSGLATTIANGVLSVCGTNPYIALAALYLVTTIMTEFVSNTATAAIFFPIAMNTAQTLDVNPMTFLIVLMVAASSSFATPIGSPTHMMVYGPGGYRFTDFMKIGIPVNFIIMAVCLVLAPLLFPL